MPLNRLTDMFRGFVFGMTLQLAVGPVCMFILTLAATSGFFVAEAGVVGVALIDTLYIALALAGIFRLLTRPGPRRIAGLCGAGVVALFGAGMVYGGITAATPAGLATPSAGVTAGGALVQTVLLTIANPLTIVFWTGVFGARAAGAAGRSESAVAFAAGCIGATLCFLTGVAAVGNTIRGVLPPQVVPAVSAAAGAFLIVFSITRAAGLFRQPLLSTETGG
jgi:threonine/homoserine/homoserine lactone efflux protein